MILRNKPVKNIAVPLAEWVLKNHFKAIVLSVIFALVTGLGMSKLKMVSQYRYFFGPDNPQLLEFDKLQKVYSKDDSVLLLITAPSVIPDADGNIFNKTTLKAVAEFTEKAWQTPYSYRVDSISNFQHSEAKGDELIVGKLIEKNDELSVKQIEKIRKVALNEPLLKNRLITEKANVTAINISVSIPSKDPLEVPEVAAFVRNLAQELETEYPGHKTHLTGFLMLNNSFFEANLKDMKGLTLIMYLTIFVIVGLLLRSLAGMLAIFIILLFSVISGMGLAGYLGIPISPVAAVAPTVILTLAVADSIHFLITMFKQLRNGKDKQAAIIESLRINLQPIFLTSITTIVGFLSLNFKWINILPNILTKFNSIIRTGENENEKSNLCHYWGNGKGWESSDFKTTRGKTTSENHKP